METVENVERAYSNESYLGGRSDELDIARVVDVRKDYSGIADMVSGYSNTSSTESEEKIRRYVETLNPTNSDVAQDFTNSLSNLVYESTREKPTTYKEAMNYFGQTFLKKGLEKNAWNVSEFARTAYGVEDATNKRCTVHKQIKNLGLENFVNMKRKDFRSGYSAVSSTGGMDYVSKSSVFSPAYGKKEYIQSDSVAGALKSVLYDHKQKIHPAQYAKLDSKIVEFAPKIAEKLNTEVVTTRYDSLKQIFEDIKETERPKARAEFEREFIKQTLKEAKWDKKKAAKYLEINLRTLNRKMEKFGIEAKLGKVINLKQKKKLNRRTALAA